MSPSQPPHRLRCEHQTDPIGLGEPLPRLSWELRDARIGALQTAYELEFDGDAAWHPGRVEGDQSVDVVYSGPRLESRFRCTWRVRIWDQNGEPTEWSDPARMEMGLLQPSDWSARWIGGPMVGGTHTSSPCPFVRREFTVTKPVVRARLYASALGCYEPYLNGERVGDVEFAPGWTDYHRRIQYQTYDVGHLLRPGTNAIGAILGDGWYCGFVGMSPRQQYGDRPKFLAQLEVDYSDGTRQVVATDSDWSVAYGPILESDLLMGESYDARLEMDGWSSPGTPLGCWLPVSLFEEPAARLVAPPGPPVRRQERLSPIADPQRLPNGSWLFDLGQNMAGRVELRVAEPRGRTITLRHSEILDEQGRPYYANLRAAKATDRYTPKGEGIEVYQPRFTFHGFRYVEVSGLSEPPGRDVVAGIVLHSDIRPSGSFECSDPLVNQLQHNIRWGQKGNFLEVPTDCPQRDERLGWTGDAQVFVRTAAHNHDVQGFFTKWLDDIADAEARCPGQVPPVVPHLEIVGPDGGPAWADAAVICPWTVYRCYEDTRILERHYELYRRFVDWLESESKDLIRAYDGCAWQGFGDWLSIEAETPKDLIGTAFLAYSARIVSKIARALGRTSDAARYEDLANRVKTAFERRFVTEAGVVATASQTCCVLALHFGLVPAKLRATVLETLVRDIERRGTRLSTGFVGCSYLPFVLSDNGRSDVAYALLEQTRWPSWLYAVTQGATTIWERWDGWTHDRGFQDPGMNSFNHYAYGSVGEWLYRVCAGLDLDPDVPGYRRLWIRPTPGGSLTRARATLHTPYGLAESGWARNDGACSVRIVVPPNTSARVDLPGDATDGPVGAQRLSERSFDVEAGTYDFVCRLPG